MDGYLALFRQALGNEDSFLLTAVIGLSALTGALNQYRKKRNTKNPYDTTDVVSAILEGFVGGLFFLFLGTAAGWKDGWLLALVTLGGLMGYKTLIEFHDDFVLKLKAGIKNFITGFKE